MQVEFFDLPLEDEQDVALPWPLTLLHFRYVPHGVRIYYVLNAGATEQMATLYLVKTDQELPDTFPGKYCDTIITGNEKDGHGVDGALHLFIKTPVNKPPKPHVVERNDGSKEYPGPGAHLPGAK